ncbi:hypothetical protein H8D85_01510 [bacterium]|nr:hypothetical protein [bacterium]
MAKLIANYRRDYPLTYHTFFLRMESWLNYDVKHLKVDNDDFRTLVFQDFLTIKFTECIRFMKDLAGKEDVWDDFHPNELKDMTINIIMQCINSYEEKAKLEGIPDIVVEKFND